MQRVRIGVSGKRLECNVFGLECMSRGRKRASAATSGFKVTKVTADKAQSILASQQYCIHR